MRLLQGHNLWLPGLLGMQVVKPDRLFSGLMLDGVLLCVVCRLRKPL